ncbi:MAG: transcriptional regulator [Actinophytocola sp.]|uniref:winged helix-turn-helix transcriptional regulator n=1 Tax=Actinophytocola sp. TaxID=1872138 RepID=UPI00132B1975|nr:helix-turn-helix domain-containing protein [Actinophytocola sp.]MPZ84209.1 transcriptional regulator [Actinophytocola sp.]
MATTRTYNQACSAAHALDLVGERWALLVVRELLLGPKRFTDLRAGLPQASPNVLTERLRELETVGVVRRRKLAPPAGSWVYELTGWGLELESIMVGLARWGGRSPRRDLTAAASADALMLALRASVEPGDVAVTCTLRIEGHDFAVRVADGRTVIVPGEATEPDAVIEADATTFGALLAGRRLAGITVTGDAAAAESLLAAIEIPRRIE